MYMYIHVHCTYLYDCTCKCTCTWQMHVACSGSKSRVALNQDTLKSQSSTILEYKVQKYILRTCVYITIVLYLTRKFNKSFRVHLSEHTLYCMLLWLHSMLWMKLLVSERDMHYLSIATRSVAQDLASVHVLGSEV